MRRFSTLFVALCAASAIASAQNTVVNSLTFTQGQYRLTLTAPSLSGDLSGTLLSTATGWALGGNALVGAGPSANLIGTTDAVDVQLIAGGTSNVRLVAESGAAAITLPTQTALRLADDAGGEYVGLRAPTGVTTYTVTLPATAPTANQVLRANAVTPTNLEWATVSGGSGWAQGGNAVTGAGNDNVLGTTTAFPLRLAAGAVANIRLEVLDAVNAVQLPTQTALRLGDAAGGEFVGLRAPTTVGTSYTVDLPAAAPTTGQVLRATSATATEWATPAGTVTREVVNFDPGNVASNSTLDIDLTTTATIGTNDLVYVHANALEAGLQIGNARRTAANTVRVRLANVQTGGPGNVNPGNQAFVVYIVSVP